METSFFFNRWNTFDFFAKQNRFRFLLIVIANCCINYFASFFCGSRQNESSIETQCEICI